MIAERLSLRSAAVVVALLTVATVSSCASSEADGRVVVVDPPQAVRLLASEEYVVLDLRPSRAYEAGHVRGARSMPLGSLEELEASAAHLDSSGHYFVYSRRAEDATVAADHLVSLGFEHVVDGGAFGLLALAGAGIE